MNLAREPSFRLGGIEVRPSTREVIHNGGRELLEPRVMSVLVRLARSRGEVVTRDDLSADCWEGRIVSDDAINRVLSRIRKLSELTGGNDFALETITKVGYRLVAVATAETAAAPPLSPAGGEMPDRRGRRWFYGILAVGAFAFASYAAWSATRPIEWSNDPTASLTLAVLPFDSLSDAKGDDVLALGLAREIRNTLSRVRGLRVVSDSSSFAIASEPLTSVEMGKRLQADLLLDGSFERTGDTVRLSVELVDGWDGVNVWTGSQSGPAADLNRLRQQLATQAFEQMVVKIGPRRIERLAEPRGEDPRSYRLLIEANQLLQTTSALQMRGNFEGSLDVGAKANALVEQALAIDPESAMALEQKARIVSLEATPELFEQKLSAFDRRTRSAEYLRRALAADPDYAPALAALGEYYRRYEWRWSTAGAMLARSVALDPNLADARVSYSYFLSGVGRCLEALEEAQTALEIDPEFGWRSMGVPRALKCLGRFDEAEKAYLDMLRQDPDNVMVLRELYLGHLVRGDADGLEALRAHLRDDVWKGVPSPDGQGWLDWTGHAVRAMRGNMEQFASTLETQLRKIVGTGAEGDGQSLKDTLRGKAELMWVLAVEFAFTGNTDQAIEMLQGAVQGGSLYIPETMPGGQFEFTPEMRADPRYQAIWRNDSRLVELVNLRRQAIADGQMAGPGRPVVDKRS